MSEQIIQLRAKVRCKECGGSGHLVHPFWIMYRLAHAELGSTEQIEAWFQDTYQVEPPDEEVDCFECCGNGSYEVWIDAPNLLQVQLIDLQVKP